MNRIIAILAVLICCSIGHTQVHPYSYWQPTAQGFVDMVGAQNMAPYGNPQLIAASIPGGYALTVDGSIQFGNLSYQYPKAGGSETIVCWWLDTSIHANGLVFSHEAGQIFHVDMGYDYQGNFDAEVDMNYKFGKNNTGLGTADIDLGPNPFNQYLNGGVFGPLPVLNTWHQGILSWNLSTQTSTFWLDGVKIGSVFVPQPNLSGGTKGMLVMAGGNYYDHDPTNSINGLIGPTALIQGAVTDVLVSWLWNNGLGRQFIEFN